MSAFDWTHAACRCGHQRKDHGGSVAPFSRPQPFYLNTPNRNQTGDPAMTTDRYYERRTLEHAFSDMLTALADGTTPWETLAVLPVSEILARYATKQRAVVAELNAAITLMETATVSALRDAWKDARWQITPDRDSAQRELDLADRLLSQLTPDTAPADTVTDSVPEA